LEFAPKFESIDYFAFNQLKVDIPQKLPDAKHAELEDRNIKLLRVFNPNFRIIMSKRGVVEH